MEIPVPSLENIKATWDWVFQRLHLWLAVIRDPAAVLNDLDLTSTDALIGAIQFAVFPIALNAVLYLPIFLTAKDASSVGVVGFFAVTSILTFILVFIDAVGQRVGAKLVRGKGSLGACTISTFYATAFGPLSSLILFSVTSHRDVYGRIRAGQVATASDVYSLLPDIILMVIIQGYLLSKYVAMTKVVHKVGRFRAWFICLFTGCVDVLMENLVMGSIYSQLFGM